MNNYQLLKNIPCCYFCIHAQGRFQLSLTCTNKKAWIEPSSVQPLGYCDYFEKKLVNEVTI